MTYSRAGLDVELADRGTVVHGVEGGDFVDAHGGHFKDASDFVHDADRSITVLALAEVEQGQDGRLLVLRRVALDDLGDNFLVLLGELEGDIRIIVGGVAVLKKRGVTFGQRIHCQKLAILTVHQINRRTANVSIEKVDI